MCLALVHLLRASAAPLESTPSTSLRTIVLDGAEVHATRILAKYKNKTDARLKLSSAALASAASTASQQFVTIPGLVVLEDADTQGKLSSTSSEEALRARLSSRIEALKASGLFEYVEPDYVLHADLAPSDRAFVDGTLWGLLNYGQDGGMPGADIGATNAWSLTTGSTNVLVAVIDTGIRYTHRDLVSQMWVNPTPGSYPGYSNDVHGINAAAGTGDPMDDVGHGTHVAGTIGASANDSNPSVGVAWNVRLMACKFLGQNGGLTSDSITCVDYAVSQGARIINASYGGTRYSQAVYDSINEAGKQGVLFVAAAGNDGLDNDQSPHYPANYALDNIVSVAALDRWDMLASFSDYGLKTVDIGAPGVEIYSTYNNSDSSYAVLDGTSMAAPHVTGIAALVLGRYPTADVSEVRDRILLGSVPISALAGKSTTSSRASAYGALTASGSGVLSMSVQPPSGSALLLSSAQTINVRLTDLFGVIDGTVTATVSGFPTNLVFSNDGKAPDVISNDAIYTAVLQVPASTSSLTMTLTATATNKVGTTNTVFYTVVPPPPNDFFTNGTKVPAAGSVYVSNNRFGTLEPGEPEHAEVAGQAASMWWFWVPATDNEAFVDTTGSSVDAVLAVYTGNSLTNLTSVASSVGNVATRSPATVQFSAKAGVSYRIAVSSVDTNSLGSMQLRVAPGGKPDSTAPVIVVNSPQNGTTVGEELVTVTGTAEDLVPNASGVSEVLVSVNGAIAQTANGTTNWTSPALLKSGLNTIRAQAVDNAGNFSTASSIQIRYVIPAPSNDFFANAEALSGQSGTNLGGTISATKQVGEPNHAGSVGGKSVWWTFEAPADGLLVLDTTDSTFDTLLALYTGTDVSNLAQVAANDDAYPLCAGGFSFISQAVRSGEKYSIALDGYDGASGDFVLRYSFVPTSVFRFSVSNSPGGAVEVSSTNLMGGPVAFSSGSWDVVSNATLLLTATPESHYAFAKWEGSVVSGENPLSVVVSSDMGLAGQFSLIDYTDGFESGNLTRLHWETNSVNPWFVQSQNVSGGLFAARSGAIGNDGSTSLRLTANVRAGSAGFSYRVSSESGWDWFGFYIDGDLVQKWSGEVEWADYSIPLQAGVHTFEWRYSKDFLNSAGEDAAFLDNVSLPIISTIDPSIPIWLSVSRTGGTLSIVLSGQSGINYTLESSPDMKVWSAVTNVTAVDGSAQFTQPVDPANTALYYRALANP
jgi:subtilisin family serine protease